MLLRVVQALKQLRWFAFAASLSSTLILASVGISYLHHTTMTAEPDDGHRADAGLEKRSTLIESEIITTTPRGFEPAEITRPEGQFILMIDNRSEIELDFRLLRENGQPLHEIRSTRQEPDWNEVLDLRPGRYVLIELDHPQWTCSITITAR
jgi:hypothetical protein